MRFKSTKTMLRSVESRGCLDTQDCPVQTDPHLPLNRVQINSLWFASTISFDLFFAAIRQPEEQGDPVRLLKRSVTRGTKGIRLMS